MAVAAPSTSLCSLPAETSPLEYSVYKPCLVLFGLVDHFQGKLKVERSSTHTHVTLALPWGLYLIDLCLASPSACVLQKKLEASGKGLPEALLDYIRQNTSGLSSVCDKVGCSHAAVCLVSCEVHSAKQ